MGSSYFHNMNIKNLQQNKILLLKITFYLGMKHEYFVN